MDDLIQEIRDDLVAERLFRRVYRRVWEQAYHASKPLQFTKIEPDEYYVSGVEFLRIHVYRNFPYLPSL